MKALSIKQPWAFAILNCDKDIENRTWQTHYRGPILVHAGKTFDPAGFTFLRQRGLYVPARLPLGAYLGYVTITGCRRQTVVETMRQGGSPWAFGPWCLELSAPAPFADPIPGPGQLGLYEAELPEAPRLLQLSLLDPE